MKRFLAILMTGVFVLASCGDDDVSTDTTTTAADDGTTTTTTTSSTTTTEGELPGEQMDLFPYEGAELVVVGVAADDVLNVRSGPGVDFEVVHELEPLADDLVATGHNRTLGDEGIWAEIEVDGITGWVNVRFVLHLGAANDITTALYPTPADRPSAETMLDLGLLVGQARASTEPASDIVVVDGPTVGDLGEITVDVIGLGDDSVGGERLMIFAEPGDESFTVRSVEAIALCTRGVTDDGLCL